MCYSLRKNHCVRVCKGARPSATLSCDYRGVEGSSKNWDILFFFTFGFCKLLRDSSVANLYSCNNIIYEDDVHAKFV